MNQRRHRAPKEPCQTFSTDSTACLHWRCNEHEKVVADASSKPMGHESNGIHTHETIANGDLARSRYTTPTEGGTTTDYPTTVGTAGNRDAFVPTAGSKTSHPNYKRN
jgi:hypothetical protein